MQCLILTSSDGPGFWARVVCLTAAWDIRFTPYPLYNTHTVRPRVRMPHCTAWPLRSILLCFALMYALDTPSPASCCTPQAARTELEAAVQAVRSDAEAGAQAVRQELEVALQGVRTDLDAAVQDMDAAVQGLKGDVDAAVQAVRTDMEAAVQGVRTDVDTTVQGVRKEMDELAEDVKGVLDENAAVAAKEAEALRKEVGEAMEVGG